MDCWYSPVSNQLPLPLKRGLQFLYSFGLSSKDIVVFPSWQSYQITNPIVRPNAIQMMDNITFRQRLFIGLFPHQLVFSYIASDCSWVVGDVNQYVSILNCSAIYPRWAMETPSILRFVPNCFFPLILHIASSATRRDLLNKFATVWTWMFVSLYIKLFIPFTFLASLFCDASAGFTPSGISTNNGATHNTIIHTIILPHTLSKCNYTQMVLG